MFARRTNARQRRESGSGNANGGVSTFTPASITSATRRFWHDAQDNATITEATGVSLWVDKFANGYDVEQATGSKQPTKSAVAFGGRQSLRFTAAGAQELILTDGPLVTDFAGGTDVAHCVYLVFQLVTIPTSILFGVDSTAAATIYSLITVISTPTWVYQRRDGVGGATSRVQSGSIPVAGTQYIARAGYTGTNADWKINGIALTTAGSSDTGDMTLDRMIYGAFGNGAGAHNSFADAYLGEAIGLTGTVSAGEEAQLVSYLKAKWGISF